MKDKVVLVTGATGSLGGAVSRAFAVAGDRVFMLVRDSARGKAAVEAIRSESRNPRIEVLQADLSDPASVRKAVTKFRSGHERLDVLVNAAAVFKKKRTVTDRGLETMFATNHLGPFLLTNLMLDLLRQSNGARVINVTAPSTVKLNFEDLQGERKFGALGAFGASKTCNLLFTYDLSRRLAETGVTVNAFHPGLVKSALMREMPTPMRLLVGLFSRRPEAAAAALVHLASSPELDKVTGQFFKLGKAARSFAYSHDEGVQRRLWDMSTRMAGLEA